MINVIIAINKKPLQILSACRLKGKEHELCTYGIGHHTEIEHHYDEGALELARKMIIAQIEHEKGRRRKWKSQM